MNNTLQSNADVFVGSSLSSMIWHPTINQKNPHSDVIILDGLPKVGGETEVTLRRMVSCSITDAGLL